MPQPARKARVLRFGAFELDLRSAELRKHGLRLRLQEQPFQILAMLLERPGELVTREELRERLWPDDTFVDFDHGLNTAVNKLRQVLGDSANQPRFIETLARRGYRFTGPEPQIVLPEEAPEESSAPGEPQLPASSQESAGASAGESLPSEAEMLPRAPRSIVRALFALAQIMYLCFYLAALSHLEPLETIAAVLLPGKGRTLVLLTLATAAIGIPVRLYLLASTGFDYRLLGAKFVRLFPLVFLLDLIWALSPLLLLHRIGGGLSIAASAALLYLPFSERTLVRMAYSRRLS